ncbi:DCL family protein [Frigoribacterium sp. CFBP 8766]|uniref:DUF3223 domain-containing protein n=1 Tax=Frigoribacterium sp. CFBP 8766 TaxID=2775273 RepID=UPI00177C992C|nr:DCL family protein [Frigoribacterium sp. CFBP 8766]
MGVSIPVILDSFSWSSKSRAEAAFRDILRNSGYDTYDTVSDPIHDQMLRELVDRHSEGGEKTGAGIDHFYIGKTSDGDMFNVPSDAIGIWISRVDGSKADFSYVTAIKSSTPKSDAKEAMRAAVDTKRMAYRADRFKSGGPVPSDITGAGIADRESAHVVYLDPTWGQLTYRFAESEGGWDKINIRRGGTAVQIGSSLLDSPVEKRWLDFHAKHAQLGVATASESAQRRRTPDDGWTP